MFRDDIVIILDLDGCITDGTFYSTKGGKFLKRFGPDDSDMLKELAKCVKIHFITADKRGFKIAVNRIETELGFDIDLVSNKPKERWEWMIDNYWDKTIIYVADGLYDFYCLDKADFGICPADSLDHVKASSDFVSERTGAKRFVADACIKIIETYNLDIKWEKIGLE